MIKQFPASLEHLYEMLEFVRTYALITGFDLHNVIKIELAAEEALVNIINYAYEEPSGNIYIQCQKPDVPGVKIIIKDKGFPFNPLTSIRRLNLNDPLEIRTLGGYGVFFILKIMDQVEYRREDDMNVLIMTKYLSA